VTDLLIILFFEMSCDEPGCNCRRVFFSVVSSLQNDIKAVIAWGWGERAFYVKWMGDDDPYVIEDLMVTSTESCKSAVRISVSTPEAFSKSFADRQ